MYEKKWTIKNTPSLSMNHKDEVFVSWYHLYLLFARAKQPLQVQSSNLAHILWF
ncbi:hypothetical protein PAE4_10069 [Bacillus altitudinis]|uniref:Uncharacterized protein n=1 Tax=Bacillus altitudinis TaxID=293387 RepID=A0A653Y8I2_BACAB|nr:hypothetical protein PAE4_10069 [Bacillus altitudinis]VXC38787.1 conserved hypothetical protein [Bacillus altitudinis]